jgi:hypothetical protein
MAYKQRANRTVPEGATGATSHTDHGVLLGSGTDALSATSAGTSGYALTSDATNDPTFVNYPTFFEVLASDPSSPSAGDAWYNSTSDLFRGAIPGGTGTWSNIASLSATNTQTGGGGTPDDALMFGGALSGSITTQRYAPNTWTAKANMGTGGSEIAGCGATGGDCLAAGGNTSSKHSERYDGSADTWSAKHATNSIHIAGNMAGDAGDALLFGSDLSGISTERYDGSADTWSTKADLNTGGSGGGRAGDASDALYFGMSDLPNASQQYNGTGDTWTNKNNLSSTRFIQGGSGPSTLAISIGGDDGGPTTTCEKFDGTNWSSADSMNTGVTQMGTSSFQGSSNMALKATGAGISGSVASAEILGGGTTTVTFTVT